MDTNSGSGSPGAIPPAAQTGPDSATPAPNPLEAANGDTPDLDIDELKSALAQARRDAAKLRVENKDLKAKLPAPDPAPDPAATERARADALAAKLAEVQVGTALQTALTGAHAVYPDVLARVLRDRVEVGDDGEPANVSDVLAYARKKYPLLFQVPQVDAATQGGAATANDMNALIRARMR